MSSAVCQAPAAARRLTLHPSHAAPPPGIVPGHVGPVFLPGSGRMVWWTGRVAIGLLHQPRPPLDQPLPESQRWVQRLLLGARPSGRATAHATAHLTAQAQPSSPPACHLNRRAA